MASTLASPALERNQDMLGDLSSPTRLRSDSLTKRALTGFVHNKMAMIGLIILIFEILCAIFAGQIAPHDPYDQDISHRLAAPFWEAKGSTANILGTDQVGRDILSRIIY